MSYAHSFLTGTSRTVDFVERSRHGNYDPKVHKFTLAEFDAHVEKLWQAGTISSRPSANQTTNCKNLPTWHSRPRIKNKRRPRRLRVTNLSSDMPERPYDSDAVAH